MPSWPYTKAIACRSKWYWWMKRRVWKKCVSWTVVNGNYEVHGEVTKKMVTCMCYVRMCRTFRYVFNRCGSCIQVIEWKIGVSGNTVTHVGVWRAWAARNVTPLPRYFTVSLSLWGLAASTSQTATLTGAATAVRGCTEATTWLAPCVWRQILTQWGSWRPDWGQWWPNSGRDAQFEVSGDRGLSSFWVMFLIWSVTIRTKWH